MPAISPLITSNLCNRMLYSSDSSASSPDEQVIRSQSISSRACAKKIKVQPISKEDLPYYLATRISPVKSSNKRPRDIASEYFDLFATPPSSGKKKSNLDPHERQEIKRQAERDNESSNNVNSGAGAGAIVDGTSQSRVTRNETVTSKKRRLNFRRRLQLRSTES